MVEEEEMRLRWTNKVKNYDTKVWIFWICFWLLILIVSLAKALNSWERIIIIIIIFFFFIFVFYLFVFLWFHFNNWLATFQTFFASFSFAEITFGVNILLSSPPKSLFNLFVFFTPSVFFIIYYFDCLIVFYGFCFELQMSKKVSKNFKFFKLISYSAVHTKVCIKKPLTWSAAYARERARMKILSKVSIDQWSLYDLLPLCFTFTLFLFLRHIWSLKRLFLGFQLTPNCPSWTLLD